MSNVQKIRSQIRSVQNIKKISKVMEMISLSKMKSTQKRMLASRPYTEIMQRVITHITLGNLEYKHSYLIPRSKVNRVGYVIVSTDRGLIGSLNVNMFKKVLFDIKKWHSEGVTVSLVLIGTKASVFFSFMKEKVISQVTGMGDHPSLSELIGPIKSILQLYDTLYIDRIYIVFNKFKNVLSQIPKSLQILPLLPFDHKKILKDKFWDYIYEPDSKILLDILLPRYVELQVYQCVVENLASEQAARMMAMKSAADSSEKIMKELQLIYNKVRQAKITQELIEIISGSSAII